MRKIILLIFIGLLLVCLYNCKKEDIYERPSWLAGKLYSQVLSLPELSTFAHCIDLVGYDSVINISGSYTVFAPNNEAFDQYLAEHGYSSVDDIPVDILERIVKFHLVQNPWSIDQLRQLDVYGWIDSLDLNNDEPKGYKRETLLREVNAKYGVNNSPDRVRAGEQRLYIIVDTTQSLWYRRQATDARKYVPIFYQEYFDIYKLNSDDYAFYFGRPFESAATFFVNAKVITPDIFAENGFVHVVDRVVEPLKNAYQLMSDASNENSYTSFLDLINNFPEFNYNEDKTYDQPGADQGIVVDSLFDITYPDLTFSIVNEKTLAPEGVSGLPANVSIRYHHGLVAPTNAAMEEFINEYLVGQNKWGSLRQTPRHIRRMMVNSHMANGPIYPSNFERGYYNGEDDWINIDPLTIEEKKYGSNCTFIGVNKMIVPRAFSSVTGPVYLRRGYSRVMYAIERTGLLPALKRPNIHYMFFVENDANLAIDSSLIYNQDRENFSIYSISGPINIAVPTSLSDIRNLILNHIAVEQPSYLPRKEFIKNLAGNYLIFNNETGEVRGSNQTTFGYGGSTPVYVIPQLISNNADNGSTYDISNWFSFSAATLYTFISSTYPAFHNLLVSAGLANTSTFTYNFIPTDEFCTVFVPNAAALAAYSTGSLTPDQLRKFLMMHFVRGSLIFTDGHKPSGFYETFRIDEKSTQYTRIYTKVYIQTGIDEISIRAGDGSIYLSVSESGITNRLTARIIPSDNDQPAYPTIVTNGVIHEIDKVLVFDEVDTE